MPCISTTFLTLCYTSRSPSICTTCSGFAKRRTFKLTLKLKTGTRLCINFLRIHPLKSIFIPRRLLRKGVPRFSNLSWIKLWFLLGRSWTLRTNLTKAKATVKSYYRHKILIKRRCQCPSSFKSSRTQKQSSSLWPPKIILPRQSSIWMTARSALLREARSRLQTTTRNTNEGDQFPTWISWEEKRSILWQKN